jgi:hypothetical protein
VQSERLEETFTAETQRAQRKPEAKKQRLPGSMNLNGCYTLNGNVNSERDVKDARPKNKSRRPLQIQRQRPRATERAAAISVPARKSEERSFAPLRVAARDTARRAAEILGRRWGV